ncbi:hypothetical protein, partial [Shewanella colwelliana]|uniref:hypothetical protein n=1 Tax=Shewanella colwelliana TaxID=23 RepID=UPI001C7D091C
MAVFTAFNILANYKFPLNEALGDPLIIQVSQQCEPTLYIHALPSVNAALLFDSFSFAELL